MLREKFNDYIESSILKNWSLIALSDYKGEEFTYAAIAEEIYRFHRLFAECGVAKGDKIALLGKNSARWCISYLAIVSYGAVVVPILPDFKPDDIQTIITHSDSVILMGADGIIESLDQSKLNLSLGCISLSSFNPIPDSNEKLHSAYQKINTSFGDKNTNRLTPAQFTLPDVGNEMLAVISYTSGTTGFSKGVMLLHNSLAANVRYAQQNMPLQPGDTIVSFLPLAHTYGCAFEFLFPFSIGCCITILTKTPSPQVVMQAFKDIRPALILSVPLVIEKIYKKQILPGIEKKYVQFLLSIPGINQLLFKKIQKKLRKVFGGNFKEIVIGGAAFNFEAERFLRKIGLQFTVGYGMTECGPLISYAPWNKTILGASGKVVDTLEVKIDSPDPENIVGEIILRGENMMQGYYKNEEATLEIIDEQGWLHTGDLGLIDREGNISIKGRSKSLILGSNGKNIYPEEIEAAINNRLCVGESLVVYRDEKLVALIFPDQEAIDTYHFSTDHLEALFEHHRKEVNATLANYMQIAKFEIHSEEFEKTPKRSIKRFLYF